MKEQNMNKNTLVKKHKDNCLETVPYILSRISAGFPSPADDYIENNLSISELLIKNQLSTFLMKASGESMIEAGINDGDVLVVDRSLEARSRDIVIAIFEGNLTVKRLIIKADGSAILKSENPLYKNILISEYTELEIWGVVTSAIHQFIK